MNRFNLTFSGEFIEGHDPELAKARMAQLLEIDDPDLLRQLVASDDDDDDDDEPVDRTFAYRVLFDFFNVFFACIVRLFFFCWFMTMLA